MDLQGAPAPYLAASQTQGPVMRNVADSKEALLFHVEALAELRKAKTQGLKTAAKALHTAVKEVPEAYQAGLDAHVVVLMFLVGL